MAGESSVRPGPPCNTECPIILPTALKDSVNLNALSWTGMRWSGSPSKNVIGLPAPLDGNSSSATLIACVRNSQTGPSPTASSPSNRTLGVALVSVLGFFYDPKISLLRSFSPSSRLNLNNWDGLLQSHCSFLSCTKASADELGTSAPYSDSNKSSSLSVDTASGIPEKIK